VREQLTSSFRHSRSIALTCTEDFSFAAKVWPLSLVQAPFSVAPCPNPYRPIRKQITECNAEAFLRKLLPSRLTSIPATTDAGGGRH
jgi:hypothetical protein